VPAAGNTIVVANEYFDALPINMAVKMEDGWHERVVTIDGAGKLAFGIAPEPLRSFEQTLPPKVRDAAIGAIYEWRPDAAISELAQRVANGGAALVIDYGHVKSGLGETFQAVRVHRFADTLAAPGLADLTAHVDFEALGSAAERHGARVHGPVEQAVLLRRLGIETRAAALKSAVPDRGADIDAALARLTAGGPIGMGALFKAIGLSDPRLGPLPGLEP
jgi:SAM-dependent MidA family methyltransferase